uniref:P-type ATPase N-terminal domain-containing protein n=1 Tax=Oryza glumipatula TaxID=40148 RepID=A0A0E0AZL1_9ORYZ
MADIAYMNQFSCLSGLWFLMLDKGVPRHPGPLKVRPHWEALALQSEYVELVAVNDSFITTEYMVTLDLAKGVYAKFIDWDEQMFDRETCTPAHSANTAISEDLGQVEYVLSDRTGTLTENIMIFRRCCMSDTLYGENNGDALKVVPIKSNDGTITYQAQSQDEEALVTAASKLNMVLASKDSNTAGWLLFLISD